MATKNEAIIKLKDKEEVTKMVQFVVSNIELELLTILPGLEPVLKPFISAVEEISLLL